MGTTISAVSGIDIPVESAQLTDGVSGVISHNDTGIDRREFDVDLTDRNFEVLRRPGGPLQQYRLAALDASFHSVELAAQFSSVHNGVLETGSLLFRRASMDLRFSSVTLERYAHQVRELSSIDPELLQEYLALINLLDEGTPDQIDPFFERIRTILQGEEVEEKPHTESGNRPMDIAVPVGATARTEENLRTFFLHVRASVTSIELSFQRQGTQKSDPLVLDLDGDGVEVSSHDSGRVFDINADGIADQSAFVAGGDAFLAMDRNSNGRIDDGSELFGDQHGAADGFQELSSMDENGDMIIDAADKAFSQLRLFDGISIRILDSAGITAIGILMDSSLGGTVNGNEILGVSSFGRTDGSTGTVADILLNYT